MLSNGLSSPHIHLSLPTLVPSMTEAPENGTPVAQAENVIPATAVQNGENGVKKDENGDIVTVFHDPENFNVKHPLMHEWTLWFTKPPSGKVCFVRSPVCVSG